MSDDVTDPKSQPAPEDELALDFSDGLASWELELDRVARAESSPLGPALLEPTSDEVELEPPDLSSELMDSPELEEAPKPIAKRPPAPPPQALGKRSAALEEAKLDRTETPTVTPERDLSEPVLAHASESSAPEGAAAAPAAEVALSAEEEGASATLAPPREEEDASATLAPPREEEGASATLAPPREEDLTTTAAKESAAPTTTPPARDDLPTPPPEADPFAELEQTGSAPRRLYQPPSAEEIERLSQPEPSMRRGSRPSDDSGARALEPTADELLEAILEDRPSAPLGGYAAQDPRNEQETTPPEPSLPTPVVEARPSMTHPTPVIRSSDRALQVLVESAEVMLELESDEVEIEDESDIDPTDVSERPGWAEKRRRLGRLHTLAGRVEGDAAAALWVSAAELAEEMSELAQAEQLYERALHAAPNHGPAHRALARLSFRGGDQVRHAQRLERWSEVATHPIERARALAQLALVRWTVQRDAEGALRAITEAVQLAPDELSYALLLARVEAASHPAHLDATLAPLAEQTPDKALAAMWWVSAGRACEARCDLVGARTLYARAESADPFAFDAQLSLSRMQHALGAHADSARSLLRTLESFDIGPVAEAVRRRAAHMLGAEGAHAEAVALLEHASDDVSLRTAMQVALASGDPELAAQAAESWVLGADGAERALALLTQAELAERRGDFAGAEDALEQAAVADAEQRLVPLAREMLARASGNSARLAEIVASEEAGRGALRAAARLAASPQNAAEELGWLREAAESDGSALPDVLALDAGSELARLADVEVLLDRTSARGSLATRVRALLALSEILAQRGEHDAARAALARAVELAPGYAPAERAVARRASDANERSAAYLREASAASGRRAAFLALRAGYGAAAGSPARAEAFHRAFSSSEEYAPAVWALHAEARRQGDLPRLIELHTREAERAPDVTAQVAHLVRAALVRAGEDPESAAEQLTRALALAPDDAILAELVLRLGDAVAGRVRAKALERLAQRAGPPFRTPLLLARAGILEDDGRGEEALAQYRLVLEESPGDPIAGAAVERLIAESGDETARAASLRRAVDEAITDAERAHALERLLALEYEGPQAVETAHSLLALAPTHPLALRTLERDAMARGDRLALRAVEERLIRESEGPRDRAARLRLYQLVHLLESGDDSNDQDIDEKVLECAAAAEHSPWLTRQLLSSAIAQNRRDLVLAALDLLAKRTEDPIELAALTVQKGWLSLGVASPALDGALHEALASYPDHPTAGELEAEIKRALALYEAAAERLESCAGRAYGNERAAHLYARAGQIWEGELARIDRAKAAYLRAAEKAFDYPGLEERLLALLTQEGDLDGLIALTRARLAHRDDPAELLELRRKLATLYEQRGDPELARRTLREAITDSAASLPAVRDLVRLAERTGNDAERVEALMSIARLSRDTNELRDAWLELAELYETKLGELAQAESAYQRVLQIAPKNPLALERLAALYRRQGRHDHAADALSQLIRSLPEGPERLEYTFELVALKREHGDERGAEELLDGLRRTAPTDRRLLERITELLRKRGDEPALTLHLNRALADLRQAIARDLSSSEAWTGLAEMLLAKGRKVAATQCADTALALGISSAPLRSLVQKADGDRDRALGGAALSELLDDIVYPESSPVALRILFRHAADALNRVAPLELRAFAAERLDKRHPLRELIAEQARWIGARDFDVYVTDLLPNAFVPVQDAPVQLLVGRSLLARVTLDEQRFLLARALKLARAQMSIACRLPPAELELLLHALVKQQVPNHGPSFLDPAALEEAAKRIGKQLKRGVQQELAPHLLELTYTGMPRFDAPSVYGVASIAASRAGLLATGQVEAALSSLLKLSGSAESEEAEAITLPNVAALEEARELVLFGIGEGFTEARLRAGKESQ